MKASCYFIETILLKTQVVVSPLQSGLWYWLFLKNGKKQKQKTKIIFSGVSEFSKRISNSTGYSDFFPHLLWQQVWFHKPTPINHPLQPVSGAWQGVYVHNMKSITRSREQIRLPFTGLRRKTSMKTWVLGSGAWGPQSHLLPGDANSKPFRCKIGTEKGGNTLVGNNREWGKLWPGTDSAVLCQKKCLHSLYIKMCWLNPSFLPPVFNLYAFVELISLPEA